MPDPMTKARERILSPDLLHVGARLAIEQLSLTALAYLLARDSAGMPLLVVTPHDAQAQQLAFELEQLGLKSVAYLPSESHSPFSDILTDSEAARSRLCLRQKLRGEGAPKLIVASAAAVASTSMPQKVFDDARFVVRVGEDIDRDATARALVRCGYLPVFQVEDEGTFSLRGGIIDVFVPETKEPVRIDLFGDEVANLHGFDIASGRSTSRMTQLNIAPIREVVFDDTSVGRAARWIDTWRDTSDIPTQKLREIKEQIKSLNFFFGIEALWPVFYDEVTPLHQVLVAQQRRIVVFDPDTVESLWERRFKQAEEDRAKKTLHERPLPPTSSHLASPSDLRRSLIENAEVLVGQVISSRTVRTELTPAITPPTEMALALHQARQASQEQEPLAPLVRHLKQWADTSEKIVLACGSLGQAQRLRDMLLARHVDLEVVDAMPPVAKLVRSTRGSITLSATQLAEGFIDSDTGLRLLSAQELFGASRPARAKQRGRAPSRAGLETLENLKENDFVVHQDHGIGQYLGLSRLTLNGVDGDFVRLLYADDDKLYVPVYRLGHLKRYHGSKEHVRVDKLGGIRWEKAKRRVRDAVLALAHTLLSMQAKRKSHEGFALIPPDGSYESFVASFPFEETPDQQRAIDATLGDLKKNTPMDRLICGDVGYGKTEVALRAAFVAVQAKAQVAVLVPTTVLAEQHRQNFTERMQSWGVVVETLSRFRTPAETKDILARVKTGAVDIVIGTHRLLTGDVHFKNLGLMIVDEEQRFGVKHKERLKQLRASVHVLTLSATPIPRTLHMATMGLRDLSLIKTPPASRSAIRTEVMRLDFEVMQEAIRRELHRGGQVFVVHNRIEGLDNLTDKVRDLVPEAKVGQAHGQLEGRKLERIMLEFVSRKLNVLVCTAIIESGIDIPSVNTMIVHRAENFGLSQLYQLRGRIGRGKERAYAYLFLPQEALVGKEALQRLSLLRRFSTLGSGFEVASHDLEMRGAGDLLGADQSGHIAAVGFEMYNALLEEAVAQARGQGPKTDIEPEIKVPVSAVFSESYMPEPLDRLGYYQRMAQAPTDEDIWDVLSEVKEMFGAPPVEATSLAELMILRRRLKALGVLALSAAWEKDALRVGLTFSPEAGIDRVQVAQLCQLKPQSYRLLPSGRLALTLPAPPPGIDPLDGSEVLPEGKVLLPAIRHGLSELKTIITLGV